MPRRPVALAISSLVVLGLALISAPALAGTSEPTVSETETESETGTESETSTEAEPALPQGDGELVIATWLPASGPTASASAVQRAAAELAVRDLNAAGGVLERPIRLHHRDSGRVAGNEGGAAAIDELIGMGVDVLLVGDSALVTPVLPALTEAGVLVLSATGDQVPRALRGDALLAYTALGVGGEAQAVAELAPTEVVLLTIGDARGLALAAGLGIAPSGEATPRSVTVVVIPAPTAVDDEADDRDSLAADRAAQESAAEQAATDAGDDALVIVDPRIVADARVMLPILLDAGVDPSRILLSSRGFGDLGDEIDPSTLVGIRVLRDSAMASEEFRRRLRESDPRLRLIVRGAEGYDAVVVAALAAQASGNDSGAAIHSGLTTIGEGYPCSSPAECLSVLADGQAIGYLGASGPMAFDEDGTLLRSAVMIAGFVDAQTPVIEDSIPVGRASAPAQVSPATSD